MNKCLIILSLFVSACIECTVLQNSLQCGVRQIRTRDLIVNGRDTVSGDWPWHAAIYHRKDRDETYACGGTLISENFVITAAHCVKGENKYQLSNRLIFVRLGVQSLNVLDKDTFQQHNVEKIYQPSENTNQSLKNDIALLKLDKSANFSEYVQPACVSLTKKLTRKIGTVVGWGVTENEELSPTLKSTQIPVVNPVECLESNQQFIGNTLDRGMFCAGYTNGTSVCNQSNVWYLGEIVSFAQAHSFYRNLCYLKGYTVFTKVVKVRLGEFDQEQDPDCSEMDGERKCAPPMKEYGIERIIRHKNYSWPYENDIALIRLNEDVGFDDHIQPICLPVTRSLKELSVSKYIVTGWGEKETFGSVKQLLKATVSVANISECRKHYGEVYNTICTGVTNSSGACWNDMGGPLSFPARYIDGMRFVQFGIVSRAVSCGNGFSAHTNLTIHMDWIMQTMKP